ncbi:DNA adenine methylase [Chitinimonas sp. PSY-7]|uniref:DNA adenine methylase n=1 Tax=Chitinimonas sp. PSY-7 TaxID=3459088 RepID=UPI00404019A8
MQQATPIIPWLGGKRRLAEHILPLFPEHECYVEPFTGGGALFFMRAHPAKCEVLNDINGELVCLYRVLQHHPEEFMRQFKYALSSRQVFEWQKLTQPETLTDIQRAARFYYLQQHAFGARVGSQSFGTATTGSVVNLMRIEESLSAAHFRLGGVTIEHLDWQAIIEKYDRPHTFFYCDPPYWETAGYGVPFAFDQYTAMADWMGRIKGNIMVSINDHPAIREAFAGFHFLELDIKYSIGKAEGERKTAGELVITNWDANTSGGLF